MGSSAFRLTVEATSPEEAYHKLVDEAIFAYGMDGYNGTISTCSMGKVRKLADKYTRLVEQKAKNIVEAEDGGRKRVADILDMGVTRYDILSVKKIPVKVEMTAKFQTRYVVMEEWSNKVIKHFDSKTEADLFAMEQTLSHPDKSFSVSKRPVKINNGQDTVSRFELTQKTVRTKPKTVKAGCRVVERHMYMLYGWAAC